MSSIYFDNELALNDYASVSCIAWSKGEARCEMFLRENQLRLVAYPIISRVSYIFRGARFSFMYKSSKSSRMLGPTFGF